jgi:hypothetical protein
VVVVIVRVIDHRGDASDRLASLPGQEQLHLRMLKKGVLTRIEEHLAFDQERRHPERVVGVHLPWEAQKRPEITVVKRNNVHWSS